MGIVKEQVCNVFTVSLKKVRNEVDFLDADNIKVSYQKNHQSFLQGDGHDHENVKGMVRGMIKYSQSTQSNKLAMPLQYIPLKKL